CGAQQAGRIRAGWRADLAIWDEVDPLVFGYALGGLEPRAVIIGGKWVLEHDGDWSLIFQ
ncbi:MAG: hypothetical protein N2515_05245, partial [Deltaproteobacteria bacterium]|nr:hypothetical protein [Deltaproteobacteria bacterium]